MNDTLPDYKIARNDFQKIVDSLNLKFETSSATAVVEGESVFLKYTATINGNSFDYSMGIGHINWDKVDPEKSYIGVCAGMSVEEESFIRTYKRKNYCKFREVKLWAKVCEKVANKLKTAPTLVDVLSCVLMDASALDWTFEDWCSEFGYDEDSRSAEKTYNACCDNARRVKKFLKREDMEKLTDLANQL
jgi:hypothetical protein